MMKYKECSAGTNMAQTNLKISVQNPKWDAIMSPTTLPLYFLSIEVSLNKRWNLWNKRH